MIASSFSEVAAGSPLNSNAVRKYVVGGNGLISVVRGVRASAVPFSFARNPAGLGDVVSLAVTKSSVLVPATNPLPMVKFGLKPEKPTNEMPRLAPFSNTSLRRLSAATPMVSCTVAGSNPDRKNVVR